MHASRTKCLARELNATPYIIIIFSTILRNAIERHAHALKMNEIVLQIKTCAFSHLSSIPFSTDIHFEHQVISIKRHKKNKTKPFGQVRSTIRLIIESNDKCPSKNDRRTKLTKWSKGTKNNFNQLIFSN